MPQLEVRYLNGDVDTVEITKQQPVSIGRHKSNDICVSDEDVDMMHCRIAWNKREFEVTAANIDGVELNGSLVRQAPFRPGDILRVGSVDITISGDGLEPAPPKSAESKPAGPPSLSSLPTSEFKLAPDPEEELYALKRPSAPPAPPPAATPARKGSGGRKAAAAGSAGPPDILDDLASDGDEESVLLPDDIFEDEDDDGLTSDVEDAAKAPAAPMLPRRTSFAREADEEAGVEPKSAAQPAGPREPLLRRVRAAIGARPVRPGEQDIIRSPFVITLGIGTAVLTLLGLIFFFMINRETANRLFAAARSEMEQRKYSQAMQLFDQFLEQYPHHKLAESAILERGKAAIEREIYSASPNWTSGSEAMKKFIDLHRDREVFSEHHVKLAEYAQKIALGAAEDAGKTYKEPLLEISVQAGKWLDQFSPADAPPQAMQKRIAAAREQSLAAIRKQRTFEEQTAAIEAALAARQPMRALAARTALLQVYPDFRTDKGAHGRKLADLLERTLETEKSLVLREELKVEALTEDHPPAADGVLSLTLHTRSRTDELSAGRTVLAVGGGCCYGIDSVTGDPLWRRVIGEPNPFFPKTDFESAVPAVLVFDAHRDELVLLELRTGKLIWRQPIGERASGPPLVFAGEIYLPTVGNHLYKVDLDRGRITTRLSFSQKVLAPPALASDAQDKDWLVIAGDAALMYTLSLRPLACEAVANLGHRAGSIQAPLVKMGRLLLLAENDGLKSCTLRALRLDERTRRVQVAGSAPVTGPVIDEPKLWGKTLFVPSQPERISAFTVADDPTQRPLTPVASHQLQNAVDGPMFVYVGPDDQVWLASTALRKLFLQTGSIKLDPAETAVGLTSQPLQSLGDRMYVGRRLPYCRSTFFTQADRNELSSQWRTVVGARLLTLQAGGQGSFLGVSDAGDVFRINPAELLQGGFKYDASVMLRVADGLAEPLRATPLGDGRLAVDCGNPDPQLWIVTALGQLERTIKLDAPLEAGPARLGEGLVLPLPGRLKYLGGSSAAAAVQDLVTSVANPQAAEAEPAGRRWRQVLNLDATQVLALDDRGQLLRVQLRPQPTPHLAAALSVELAAPADRGVTLSGDKLFLGDADGRLQMLDAFNLDTLSELSLKAPLTAPPWAAGELLLVETGGDELHAFATAPDLKLLWQLPLDGLPLAGAPLLHAGRLVVALQDGRVWSVDPQSGQIAHRVDLGQRLALGPHTLGEAVVVPTVDGSLYRIETALQTAAFYREQP